MARALLVVPRRGLSVNQYRRTRQLLEEQGIQVEVAAPGGEKVVLTDFTVTPDVSLEQASVADHDLVVFVAGRGNRELWSSSDAHRVAKDALAAGKVIGASGAAVGILANAHLLGGRRATGPISLAAMLRAGGADYTAEPVTVDDGIVTLRRSEAFESFGEQLLQQLRRKEETRRAA